MVYEICYIIFVYSCETWTLTSDLERRITALELRCYRRILNISYKDRVTNARVREIIQSARGPHDDLLTTVKKRKLQWYGHLVRSSGLAKTILQGTVNGSRKRGRQRRTWSDNISNWTGLSLAATLRIAEDRTRWREVVRKSSVVPLRLSSYGRR